MDVDQAQRFEGRGHFFAAAAEAMRRILIDSARRRQSQKRGGGWVRDDLDAVTAPEPDDQPLALDEALEKRALTEQALRKLSESSSSKAAKHLQDFVRKVEQQISALDTQSRDYAEDLVALTQLKTEAQAVIEQLLFA